MKVNIQNFTDLNCQSYIYKQFCKRNPETKNQIRNRDLRDTSTATVNALVTLEAYYQLKPYMNNFLFELLKPFWLLTVINFQLTSSLKHNCRTHKKQSVSK